MKLAYFDCFAGAAGDMILGALIDAGLPFDFLKSELAKLKLDGFDLQCDRVMKNGISGTKLSVITGEQNVHRHLGDITEIIDHSDLSGQVKSRGIAVFETLARAEAKIHGTTTDKIHFHEVGALDAIVDIVGTVIGLDYLGIRQIMVSPVHFGTGFIECEHGKMPVPAPATLEILKGAPTWSSGIRSELTTPTGAALLKTLADSFGPVPPMTTTSVGYGAGSRDLEIPNMIRVVIGESATDSLEIDEILLMECNLDDMTGERLGYVMERLLSEGARDVWFTPIQMKKNRPAVTLSVLADQARYDALSSTIFAETSTIGIRTQRLMRRKLKRETRTVRTHFGEIRVKVSRLGRTERIAPEYEDCREAALREGVPLAQVYDEVMRSTGSDENN